MDRALAADARLGRQSRIVTARRLLDERGVLLGLVVVAATFGVLIGPQFFAAANLELMARQTAIVCVAALGMTMVIVAGGIDLSVGSIFALSTVVTALLLRHDSSAGGAFIAASSLPTRTIVTIDSGSGGSKVGVTAQDAVGFGLKTGMRGKYERWVASVVDGIRAALT